MEFRSFHMFCPRGMKIPWRVGLFHTECHGVPMENFARLFPHGNSTGYETGTAILQDRRSFFWPSVYVFTIAH